MTIDLTTSDILVVFIVFFDIIFNENKLPTLLSGKNDTIAKEISKTSGPKTENFALLLGNLASYRVVTVLKESLLSAFKL